MTDPLRDRLTAVAARLPWDVWTRMSPTAKQAVRRIFGRYADAVLQSPEFEECLRMQMRAKRRPGALR